MAINDPTYDPNEGTKGFGKPLLPNPGGTEGMAPRSVAEYVKRFTDMDAAIQKAIAAPPEMQSFARISYMPEIHNSGVLQWPGLPAEALTKITRENIAPLMIIGMRVADVMSYAELSNHPWKPGWRIELREASKHPSKSDLAEIRKAEQFLLNCNIQYHSRERDEHKLTSFRTFLSELTRNTLTYDGMAIWTDMDTDGRVQAFKCLSAANIRLSGKNGYQGDLKKFAVAVDEAGNVLDAFTRDQLTWYVRNPRADADIGGYGYSEIEQAIRTVQGFQNALDMGVDAFNKNRIPNGMMLLKGGGWVQKQLDALARIWTNLKSGVTKSWALPVMAVPKDGDVTILDLTDIKGKEVYYQDFMNMVVGALCTVYRFPPRRLGYRISGKGPDSQLPNQTAPDRSDEEDIGRGELLGHIQLVVNEYLLWTRFPHLQMVFTGKNPKEDAREYEARSQAMTVDERRALSDLPPLSEKEGSEEMKKVAEIMGNAPTDPALTGIYQAAVAAVFGKSVGEGSGPESLMGHKKDPAISEEHGHMSGVRRDSAKEAESAAAGNKAQSNTDNKK